MNNKFISPSKIAFIFFLTFNIATASALTFLYEPIKLTWEMLKDVSFKKKWYPNEGIFMLAPTFGNSLKSLETK
nr:hypothetical protein [Pseudarcicella sp.]